MRQIISAVVAAIAVMTMSAAPAMACGGSYWGSVPCVRSYVPIGYYGCYGRCGGGAFELLPDPVEQYHSAVPVPQYYYVNQGPTFTGPGNFAPYPTYQEGGVVTRYHRHGHVHGWRAHHRTHYGYRAHVRRYY
jgi:hypothetical protein